MPAATGIPEAPMYDGGAMMEEGKTEALGQFPEIPDSKEELRIEWDKAAYDVCITEWVKQGHVVYKIKGIDQAGEFDIQRRYNHFHVLREVLVKRWPAFYIPPISPKKAVGNKDEKVVEERWYMLNRFMQQLSKIDYLWKSDEMAAFL